MRRVFVVSDLHLGGAPGGPDQPDFQMCAPASRRRLADFFVWAAGHRSADRDVHIVINGDIVDFLAEEDPKAATGFAAFTADEAEARRKLERIFERTHEVWDGLRAARERGARVSLVLGNHDVELTLPACRRALVERLGGGALDLVFNGEALPLGPVLIEHGNRSDAWNQIDHDTLRELCSELSRREQTDRKLQTPGSELVVRVMNELKKDYAFIDLLKPEGGAVLPLLAVLEPGALRQLVEIAALLPKLATRWIDTVGKPYDRRNIGDWAGGLEPESGQDMGAALDEDLELARALAGEDGQEVASFDKLLVLLAGWREAVEERARELLLSRLLRALRWLNRDDRTFDVGHEHDPYLSAARAAARRGFRCVVFGHTHKVKRVDLGGGATYLNTGTWADLMRLPEKLHGSEDVARAELTRFLKCLESNDLAEYREQHPTFAQIDHDFADHVESDVSYFSAPDEVTPVPTGTLERRPAN